MKIKTVRTGRIKCGDSLEQILKYIPSLEEKTIVAITSKIISLSQRQVVSRTHHSKEELVQQEADAIAPCLSYGFSLTIKEGVLIPSAGIDESNADDKYILYPKDIQATATSIWQRLRKRHSIKDLGVIITDSHVTPMRWGVTGVSIGWCGFEPLYSYIGRVDLYKRPLQVTRINLLDALAASAVLMMGEGSEQTPIALINDAPKITFLDRSPTVEEEKAFKVPLEEDLYAPILKPAFTQNQA